MTEYLHYLSTILRGGALFFTGMTATLCFVIGLADLVDGYNGWKKPVTLMAIGVLLAPIVPLIAPWCTR